MYRVLEASLGDLTRLYQYTRGKIFETHFDLKGFDNPWLISARSWKKGERVLDVGGAYSKIPLYLQKEFGCEVWVVDDFGLEGDTFWTRGASPQEYIKKHPKVKYVLERLGDPGKSSLPTGYFDVIYSLSVLEHVPRQLTRDVWQHMDLLLKPGGEMLHAVDLLFPSNRGLWKVIGGALFDAFYGLVPNSLRTRFSFSSPLAYSRLALKSLNVRYRFGRGLSVLNMVLNPDILTEGYEFGINRMEKDGMLDYKYQRTGTLLLRLLKGSN